MRIFRHGEPPQVAHDLENVLVDRIDVEQVVLHLADDAAEGRDVVAENVVLVHPPQFMGNAAFLLEQLNEQRATGRIMACCGSGAMARCPQRPQGPCRQTAQFGALGHDQENFQYGVGFFFEQTAIDNIKSIAHSLKATVDVHRRRARPGRDASTEIEQYQGVQLGHQLRIPVVAEARLLAVGSMAKVRARAS